MYKETQYFITMLKYIIFMQASINNLPQPLFTESKICVVTDLFKNWQK